MISLLHPSRSRPQKAKETFLKWMDNSSGEIEIEHILSLDTSDPLKTEYLPLFPDSKILLKDNDAVVSATNYAAKESRGNILIYLSDDFDCPLHWDITLNNIFKDKDKPLLVKVDDGLQPFHARVLTIPIMNRKLYERLGYFWNPKYSSMCCDMDLFEVVLKNNWITYTPGIRFEHNHWINKKADVDETYKRTESFQGQGEQVFNQRKAEGFPC